MLPAGCKQRCAELLGPRGYLDRPEDLTLYEYDGGVEKHRPDLVVFPRTTAEVSAIARIAREFGVPLTGRGAGTGLSGGAIPREGGILVAFARMNKILEIDLENERAVVQPGVVNLDITLAVQDNGFFYAPDPSSQRACTIGGNVAENAGGPHTLAYGVTTNHVLGLEVVLPDGTVVEIGGKEPDLPGYDLAGVLTGSEGTMVLVTKVVVRLMRRPESVKTALAIYRSNEDAGRTVSEIAARGIIPVAVETLHIASQAGSTAQRKNEAARVAQTVLNENVLSGNWGQSMQGTIRRNGHDYPWRLHNETWQLDAMQLVTAEVVFSAGDRTSLVRLSTLVNPTNATISTVSIPLDDSLRLTALAGPPQP